MAGERQGWRIGSSNQSLHTENKLRIRSRLAIVRLSGMRWRIWLYVFALLVIVSVIVDTWTEQAGGGFSSGDRLLYTGFGLILVTPIVLFDFLRWVIRHSMGLWPAVALVGSVVLTGVIAGLLIGSTITGCIRESADQMICWSGYQIYLGLLVADVSMVLVLLMAEKALVPPANPPDEPVSSS